MTRQRALRLVLAVYAAGHIFTAVLFTAWPGWFVDGSGPRAVFPFTLVSEFGAWPPLHQGFMNVIAAYDLAVAVALVVAARRPARHTGILLFVTVLWVLHGAVHAYHIVWGTSPGGYWPTVAELWLGAALVAILWPKQETGPGGRTTPVGT